MTRTYSCCPVAARISSVAEKNLFYAILSHVAGAKVQVGLRQVQGWHGEVGTEGHHLGNG